MGAAGLLHDLDYEKFPEDHCHKAEKIMREHGLDETYIRAMNCHAYGICTDVRPESNMEKVLFTVDWLPPGFPLRAVKWVPGSQAIP